MKPNKFEGTGPKLTIDDLRVFERKIGTALPSSFIEHYILYNGGQPKFDWVPGRDDWDPTIVQEFYQITPNNQPAQPEDMYEHYKNLVKRKFIPQNFLPFAVDPGGNFYVLDLELKEIGYFLTEGDTSLRLLFKSFGDFLRSLTDEDSAYG